MLFAWNFQCVPVDICLFEVVCVGKHHRCRNVRIREHMYRVCTYTKYRVQVSRYRVCVSHGKMHMKLASVWSYCISVSKLDLLGVSVMLQNFSW